MKTFRALLVLSMFAAVSAWGQVVSTAPVGAPVPTSLRSAAELEQLLAPVALYPDALMALMLPAATVPTDIVLAARHLRENGADRSQIEHRAWDESVKSLTHYPDVLKWMDDNLDWTKQVGEAFASQPADVMQAVQRLRATARAAGTLVDTPQQQVISEPQVIRIVPAQANVIYVPQYEPEVVFIDRPIYYPRPVVTFGMGVAVGSWLASDCDWHRNTIWVGSRHRRWSGHDWRRPVVSVPVGHHRTHDVRPWHPPAHPVRTSFVAGHFASSPVLRPSSFGSASSRSHGSRHGPSDQRGNAPSSRPAYHSPSRVPAPPPAGRPDFSAVRPPTTPVRPPTTAVAPPVAWTTPTQSPAPASSHASATRTHQSTRRSNTDPQSPREITGARSSSRAAVAAPSAALPMAAAPTAAPHTFPASAPVARSNHARTSPRPSAAMPTASLPMANPPSAAPHHFPASAPVARTYSRSGAANGSQPPAYAGSSSRSHSRGSPPPASPVAAAPAAAAPAPAAATPPAAPAPGTTPGRIGDGGWRGRRSNEHAR